VSEAEKAVGPLIALMARLRDPDGGCPWDREQTFATIAPYTIEEAYEVADAIEDGSPDRLRDELGDLLFQVVFHARMAEERGWFDFAGVARAIHEKLIRRHPHVFAGASVAGLEEQTRTWEQLKALERARSAAGREGADSGTLADVPRALPALTRAAKLGRRASRVGFDWQSAAQVREKVAEELAEADEAVAGPAADAAHVAEEIGDLLFALANWSRHLHIDAEQALHGANRKFERRFRVMEALASAQDRALDSLSAAEWEDLWEQAKQREAHQQR
jgi:nucleoside triphosphate diphosphatase